MLGSEPCLHLALILGIALCAPFFWTISRELTKYTIYKLFPPRFILISTKRLNGTIEQRKVAIDDTEALVNALLEGESSHC